MPAVAFQAERAMKRIDPLWAAKDVSYEEAFQDLYNTLGKRYPCFQLKNIDWQAAGKAFLLRVKEI